GQNKSINKKLTKETSTLQDTIITSTPIVQQLPITPTKIFHKSPVITSSSRIQNSQVFNSRIPTIKNIQLKSTSSTIIKSSIIKKDDSKDNYEKEIQDILEYNPIEFFENEQSNNLNDLGGDVSNLSHLNGGGDVSNLSHLNGGTLNLCESSGILSSSGNSAGVDIGTNDDIRTIYERWKLVLPKDDLVFDQYSSCVDRFGFITSSDGKSPAPPLSSYELRLEKKETQRSLKWASWVSSNKFVKKSGKFGSSSYVFPWDKKQIGYCQGMTNIVTILLMYYTEECALIMLTKLFTKCNLHNLFIPGFPALLESFYVQEKLLLKYAPKIASQFNKIELSTTAYATRWYITLFTSDVVPHHTVLRIWDLLMLHGFDILYFVAVALLKYHKATLITSSFEHTMIMLSTTLVIKDDDRLIKKVKNMFELKGRKGLIDTLKAEYRSQAA
ncbi:23804_t:CDS:2, partial [Gigaspora rosea]